MTYIGFCLGAVNLFILYPLFFSDEQLGLTQVFANIALPLVNLSGFGVGPLINRFFPYYHNYLDPRKNDLLKISLLLWGLGFVLVVLLAYFNQEFIYRKFGKSPLLVENFHLLPIYASGWMVYNLLSIFVNNYRHTTWPAFAQHIAMRILIAAMVLILGMGWLNFEEYITIFSAVFWGLSGILVFKLIKEGKFYFPSKMSTVTKRLRSKMMQYLLSYSFATVFRSLASLVDIIAITGLQGLAEAAYFSVAMYFIRVVEVPQKAIVNIATPIISDAWRRNDLREIQNIYEKSSTVLLVSGGLIFLAIWINIHELLVFMPESFAVVAEVFFVLGLAKLVDMIAGVNIQILANSKKYWKLDIISNILLVVVLIPLSYFLIKEYGIMGAAYAKLIAFTLFNLLRGFFLYFYEKLVPFREKSLWVMLLFTLDVIGVNYLNQLVALVELTAVEVVSFSFLKTLIFAAINLPILYRLNVSEDLNAMVDQLVKKIFNKG